MRESATKRYKVFQIPVDWMLDSGYVSQVISMQVILEKFHIILDSSCKQAPDIASVVGLIEYK